MQLNEMNRDWDQAARNLRGQADKVLAARKITDAEEFYQEVIIPSGLFEEVYELYPDYNRSQSDAAADWILRQIEDAIFEEGDPNWENMKGDLYDKILAGLT